MDQKTLEKSPGFASLQADITQLIGELREFAGGAIDRSVRAAADD
jgi:hypothetical protein